MAWHQRSSWIQPRAGFTVDSRTRLALFRGAASFTVFQHFLLRGTSLKPCLRATSVLNELFKNGVKISLATGCCVTVLCLTHLFLQFNIPKTFI